MDAKHPASSKILVTALVTAVLNAVAAARPEIVAALPAWGLPAFDAVAALAVAAFRLWSSGAALQLGAGFRLGR